MNVLKIPENFILNDLPLSYTNLTDDFINTNGVISIIGSHGSGKTILSCVLYNELVRKNMDVIFITNCITDFNKFGVKGYYYISVTELLSDLNQFPETISDDTVLILDGYSLNDAEINHLKFLGKCVIITNTSIRRYYNGYALQITPKLIYASSTIINITGELDKFKLKIIKSKYTASYELVGKITIDNIKNLRFIGY